MVYTKARSPNPTEFEVPAGRFREGACGFQACGFGSPTTPGALALDPRPSSLDHTISDCRKITLPNFGVVMCRSTWGCIPNTQQKRVFARKGSSIEGHGPPGLGS